MKINTILSAIKDLSLDDLNAILLEIDRTQKSLSKRKQEVIAFAKERGVTLTEDDLSPIQLNDGRSSVKAKYKYTDANGKAQFWSGRGRKPSWAKEMTEKEIEQYRIQLK